MIYFFPFGNELLKEEKQKIVTNVIYQLATRVEINFSYNFTTFQEIFQIIYKERFLLILVQNVKFSNFPYPLNTNQHF